MEKLRKYLFLSKHTHALVFRGSVLLVERISYELIYREAFSHYKTLSALRSSEDIPFSNSVLITHRNSIFIVKGDIRKAVSNRIYQNLVFMITSSIFPAAIERMENCLHELISMILVIFWHPTRRQSSLNRDRFDSPLTYTDETEFF